MSFSTRNHPELGHDKVRDMWYIAGGNTYRYKEKLKEAGGQWDKNAGHWIFPSATDGRVVAHLCQDLVFDLINNVWRNPNSKAGQKRKRDATKEDEFKKRLTNGNATQTSYSEQL